MKECILMTPWPEIPVHPVCCARYLKPELRYPFATQLIKRRTFPEVTFDVLVISERISDFVPHIIVTPVEPSLNRFVLGRCLESVECP
jgi:hypothetical protein